MDSKGWGLSDMLVLCAILVLALLVTVIVYYNTFGTSLIETPITYEDDYKILEEKVEKAANNYIQDNRLDIEDTIDISVSKLMEEGYLSDCISDNGITCSGYVLYDGKEYNSYIKCGTAYVTNGYTSILDK